MYQNNFLILKQPLTLVLILIIIMYGHTVVPEQHTLTTKLIVMTVTNSQTNSLRRYTRAARENNLEVKLLTHTDKSNETDPHFLVKTEVERLEKIRTDMGNLIVMYTNSEAIILGNSTQIIGHFLKMKAEIVISGTPGANVDNTCVIGYASALLKYLRNNTKIVPKIKYDKTSSIFQIVNEASVGGIGSCTKTSANEHAHHESTGILELRRMNGGRVRLMNTLHHTKPLVLFSGPNVEYRSILTYYENYLIGNEEDTSMTLTSTENRSLPTVFLGLFIMRPTPFFTQYFETIKAINYPVNQLHIFIYNKTNHKDIDDFLVYAHAKRYASVKIVQTSENPRTMAIDDAIQKGADFYFNIDSEARLTNPDALRILIEEIGNKQLISPLLAVPYKIKSNYWGIVNRWGKPRRGKNYNQIIEQNLIGLWSVPCVSGAYLVNLASEIRLDYKNIDGAGSVICQTAGTGDEWPFYLTNRTKFGHLISTSSRKIKPDLFQMFENRYDWELNYLHPKYKEATNIVEEPCPDVFWFPLLSKRFCTEIIELMENCGKWTTGTNFIPTDGEIHPNWDPYPTVDIDLKLIRFDRQWYDIVKKYIRPVQLSVFGGHRTTPFIDTTIVIRYRPEEQSSNRPHHDTSTYTINIALNDGFEGGGCKFIRQNCSVTKTRIGWALIHPGELTHFHEGLSTTKGTRYIMVSFIDPRKKDIDDAGIIQIDDDDIPYVA